MLRQGKVRKGRRAPIVCAVTIAIMVFFSVFSMKGVACAYTAEEEAALEELGASVEELLESLNTEELQAYLNTLTEFQGMNIRKS